MMSAVERTNTTLVFGRPDRLPVDLHNFSGGCGAGCARKGLSGW